MAVVVHLTVSVDIDDDILWCSGVVQTGRGTYSQDTLYRHHNLSDHTVALQPRHVTVHDVTDAVSLHRAGESSSSLLSHINVKKLP